MSRKMSRACAMKQRRKHHHMDCAYSNAGAPCDCNCEELMPCCGQYSKGCPCYKDNKEKAKQPLERCDCGLGQFYCTGSCEV